MDDASQPIPQHIIEAALCKAFADAPIKPMSVAELAPIYGLNRRKMRLVLKSMGAQAKRIGHKWVIPLSKMPHTWLMTQGILPVQK